MNRLDMIPIEMEICQLLHRRTETPHDALGVLAAVTLAIQEEEIAKYLKRLGYVTKADLVGYPRKDLEDVLKIKETTGL
jgi:hypothetical protein